MEMDGWKSESGFTLIEVLVATAVMGLLSATLMMMMEQVNQTMVVRRASATQMVDMHVTSVSLENNLSRLFFPGIMRDPGGAGWRFKGGGGNVTFAADFGDRSPYDGCDPAGMDKLSGFESLLERQESDGASDRRSAFLFLIDASSAVVRDCAFRRRHSGHDGADADYGKLFPDFDWLDDPTQNLTGDNIGDNIDMLIIRFYDHEKEEWVEEWDSEYEMPRAIEYAFRVISPDDHVSPAWFRGMTRIKTAN